MLFFHVNPYSFLFLTAYWLQMFYSPSDATRYVFAVEWKLSIFLIESTWLHILRFFKYLRVENGGTNNFSSGCSVFSSWIIFSFASGIALCRCHRRTIGLDPDFWVQWNECSPGWCFFASSGLQFDSICIVDLLAVEKLRCIYSWTSFLVCNFQIFYLL
jgi:hypothetical protein